MSKKEPICPLLKKPCIGHDCMWYAHIVGDNPQTGAAQDFYDCSIKWLPIMLTESARMTRGVQAAVESHRNEAVKQQAELNEHLAHAAKAIPIMNMIEEVVKISRQPPPPAIEG